MSSPFNYEIDEKNLRARLREMSVPYREDAWIQFETYSEYNKSAQRTRHIPEFSFNLSRNIIIPAIFGCAVLLLSFILYKFVDIKDEPITEVKEQVKTPITPPPPAKEIIKAAPIDTAKKDTADKDTLALTTTPTVATPPVSTPAISPSIASTPSIAVSPTVAGTELKAISSWYIYSPGDVYESPNIASKVVGSVSGGKSYPIYEITNYFIKIKLDASGNYGFVLKRLASNADNPGTAAPKKKKTAEEMETKPLNTMLPTSTPAEDEPQLK